MRYLPLFILFILGTMSMDILAQSNPAELLSQSINYHDPLGVWNKSKCTFFIKETRPDAEDRHTRILIDHKKDAYILEQLREGQKIKMQIKKGKTKIWFNDKEEIDTTIIKKYRLTAERALTMKNYYTYLYSLPMRLKNDGGHIDPEIIESEFNAKKVLTIKVTYPPEIGNDTWYFYFAPDTKQLVGYRFYHDEQKNDGEFIVLEGTTQVGSFILPQKRSWYTNDKKEFLGTDLLVDSFNN